MENGIRRLLAGFLAGVAATVPMTISMIVLHELTTDRKSRPLPPYEITMRVSNKAGFLERLHGEEQRSGLTTLAHFAYGGFAASIYSLLAAVAPLPALLSGVAYGLGFWASNYAGMLPALRLYPGTEDEPAARRAVTIISHVIWGASLGLVLDRLAPESRPI